jgi:hypothetical protein
MLEPQHPFARVSPSHDHVQANGHLSMLEWELCRYLPALLRDERRLRVGLDDPARSRRLVADINTWDPIFAAQPFGADGRCTSGVHVAMQQLGLVHRGPTGRGCAARPAVHRHPDVHATRAHRSPSQGLPRHRPAARRGTPRWLTAQVVSCSRTASPAAREIPRHASHPWLAGRPAVVRRTFRVCGVFAWGSRRRREW